MTYDEIKRQLLDLKAQRTAHINAATAALEGNNEATFDAEMKAASDLDTKITRMQNLLNMMQPPADEAPAAGAPAAASRAAQNLRASNEYVRAFCQAQRLGVNRQNVNQVRGDFGILLDALTEAGGDPVGSDGGFLVPVDMQTRINELRREMVDLSRLVTVEGVTTATGYRVLDTAPTKGFTKVAEMGAIPKDDQPKFTRVPYSISDYALIVPISNDLLADNDAGLMEYLARWLARKSVITYNLDVLAKLGSLAAAPVAAGKEISTLKRVLNKGLDPAISVNAILLANQSAYDCLDQLEDKNGRDLLQPDLMAATGYQFKQHHIHMAGDNIMPNGEDGAPLYVGDLTQFMTIFDRQVMEIATTNVGGSAWGTNSTEARAIMRFDSAIMDTAAAKRLSLAGGLEAGA